MSEVCRSYCFIIPFKFSIKVLDSGIPFTLSVLQNFIIDEYKKTSNFSENVFWHKISFWGMKRVEYRLLSSINVEYQSSKSSAKNVLTSSETSPSSSAFLNRGYNSNSLYWISMYFSSVLMSICFRSLAVYF